MCVSLLVHHRDKLFKCQELTEIFEVIARYDVKTIFNGCGLPQCISLNPRFSAKQMHEPSDCTWYANIKDLILNPTSLSY